MEQDTVISFQDVVLGYGRKPVLTGLSFSVMEKDFFGIIGPNGSGKTTILRAILGQAVVRSGQIEKEPGMKLGYVMQRQHLDDLFPFTVWDVVAMGRYGPAGPLRFLTPADRQTAKKALSITGIAHLENKPFRSLSGGQKQRTLVARALAFEPDVLLLDEPTNDLDIQGEEQVMSLIQEIHHSFGITIILVSHLLNVLFNCVNRVMFLKEDAIRVYTIQEAVRSELLQKIYGIPVTVEELHGRRVFIPFGNKRRS